MDYLPEVLKVIDAGIKRDPQKVERYVELLVEKLQAAGDIRAATAIQRSLSSVKSAALRPLAAGPKPGVPVDAESRVSLADISRIDPSDAPLILSDRAEAAIQEYITAYERTADLVAAGLSGPGHILLYGPPGCGKSQSARYIAASLKLPLVTARLDGIVSSFLGSTAKNLRSLFDYVDQTPCVFFLDEFDAVAKMRDDPHELGELKRVVNSLIQNMDLLPWGTSVIAATNHPHLLDSAVWRRFEYHIEISPPDRVGRERLFELYLPSLCVDAKPRRALTSLTDGLTAADVRMISDIIRREAIISSSSAPDLRQAVTTTIRFRHRNSPELLRSDPSFLSEEDQIRFLRASDPHVFTYDVISSIVGVSKGKISSILNYTTGEDS